MADQQALRVDPTNADQVGAWNGDEGEYWAAHADQFDRGVRRYHRRLLDGAEIDATANVLDLGCGTGQATRDAARIATSGSALGLDLSARMLAVARRLAEEEGVANVRFEQADAQVHPFAEQEFDVAISRTGAMFFGDPLAAFTNIARALRLQGRLVLLVWQEFARNEWIREISTAMAAGRSLPSPPPEAPGPFSLSDPDRVRKLLSAAGFTEPHFEGLTEPMYFGADGADACTFVAGLTGWMLEGLDANGRARALDALRKTMDAHQSDEGVALGSAAWLITAARI